MGVKIISIEGNIGSGKSTVIHNLEQKLKDNKNYVFLREPVDIWQTIKDVVDAHDPKRTLGQELYYLVPLFANPKYVLDEHHFAIIND